MEFTIRHPTTGALERRRHIPYVVRVNGNTWEAWHAEKHRLVARDYISEAHLRASMATCTEPAKATK
jgi:hypothetical protein